MEDGGEVLVRCLKGMRRKIRGSAQQESVVDYLIATANYNYIGTQPAYTIPNTWSSTPYTPIFQEMHALMHQCARRIEKGPGSEWPVPDTYGACLLLREWAGHVEYGPLTHRKWLGHV